MVKMTMEEEKVANFLTEKKFKWKFQPVVYVQDEREMPRLFNPDFLLTDLNIYIEVCGAERTEKYERRDLIYKKDEVPIIYVETYKDEDKWKYFLIQSIKEIQEKRQSTVSEIIPSKELTQKPQPITKLVIKETTNKYFKSNMVSQQSQIGIMLTVGGICLIILSLFTAFLNILLAFIFLLGGFVVFYFGVRIVSFRFLRWFIKWYKTQKDSFNKWLNK